MRSVIAYLVAVLGAMLVVGCAAEGDIQTDETAAAVQGPNELAVLSFVNDQELATFEELDVECALRSDSARNIIAHRDGGDGIPATADDDLFDNLDELDGVSRVGGWTIGLLYACAERAGYGIATEDVSLLNFLNDQTKTDFDVLDDTCSLRSDAARNIIDYRDGPDGVPGTVDDDPFHSAAEVDAVARVGEVTMSQLRTCSEDQGYGAPGFGWKPLPPEHCAATVDHPSVTLSVTDCVISIYETDAPLGTTVTIEFDEHTSTVSKLYGGWHTSLVGLNLPEGYGAADIGMLDGAVRVQFSKDPPGAPTTAQALESARDGLVVFLREDRIHRPDWQAETCSTWQACLAEGIMEGIEGFGTLEFDEGTWITRRPYEYEFSGRGPLRLGTRVIVSKATGEPTYFYVEID